MNSFLAIHHLRAHKKNEKNSENVGKTMIFQVQVIPGDSKAQKPGKSLNFIIKHITFDCQNRIISSQIQK